MFTANYRVQQNQFISTQKKKRRRRGICKKEKEEEEQLGAVMMTFGKPARSGERLQLTALIVVVINTLLIASVRAQLYEGDACSLQDGSSGICTKATECRWFRPGRSERKHCSWSEEDRRTEVICCRLPDPIGVRSSLACEQRGTHLFTTFHIIEGEEADPGEFPFMAALGYQRNNNDDGGAEYDFRCGASLISSKFLLTAAHCFKQGKPVVALLGTVKLDEVEDDGRKLVMIKQVHRHPKYEPKIKLNDIALVELDRAVELNEWVNTICLYPDTNDVPEGIQLKTEGYGIMDTDRLLKSRVLLKVNLTTVPLDDCTRQLDIPGRKLVETQYCAVGQENTMTKFFGDACEGDSGGPLQIKQDGRQKLVGVTSFGAGCGSGKPGVYTRVASFIGWIESIVWS